MRRRWSWEWKNWPAHKIEHNYLRKVLVTGMIDAFCELIASLIFPWLVCLFLGFSVPLFLPWKPAQRKSKNIKGNQRKPKETKGNESKSKDTLLWRMHGPVMLLKLSYDITIWMVLWFCFVLSIFIQLAAFYIQHNVEKLCGVRDWWCEVVW